MTARWNQGSLSFAARAGNSATVTSERSTKSKCRREPDVTPGVAQRFKSYGNRFGEVRIARAHDSLNERGIIVHRVRVLVQIVPKDIRLFRAFGDLKRPCGIYARDHIRRLNLIVQPSAPTVGDLKRQTIQCGFSYGAITVAQPPALAMRASRHRRTTANRGEPPRELQIPAWRSSLRRTRGPRQRASRRCFKIKIAPAHLPRDANIVLKT